LKSADAAISEVGTLYQDRSFRTWTGPFPFSEPAIRRNAPSSCGVYQILYLGQPVYIGISDNSIRSRLQKHARGLGNWATARRTNVAGYEFVYFLCDGHTAKQIESHVLTSNKPSFNVKPEYKHYIDNITVH
jgi:predicted GIY-YIG superfamily endonuclease